MARVYSQATCVVAWLGRLEERVSDYPTSADEPRFSNAMEAADFIYYLARCDEKRQYSPSKEWGKYVLNCLEGYPDAKEGYTSLYGLSRRSYWNRLWIIQECLLASTLVIQCDQVQISGNDMLHAFRQIKFLKWYLDTHGGVQMPVPIRFDLLKSTMFNIIHGRDPVSAQYLTTPTLFGTILTYRASACKNLLDKAYGFLGVVLPCCKNNLDVDYSVGTQKLCHTVMWHYLAVHGKGAPRELHKEVEILLSIFRCDIVSHPREQLGAVVSFAPSQAATTGPIPCEFIGMVLTDPVHDQKIGPEGTLYESYITILFPAAPNLLLNYLTSATIRKEHPSFLTTFLYPAEDNLDQMGLPSKTEFWLKKLLYQVSLSGADETGKYFPMGRSFAHFEIACNSLHRSDVRVGDLVYCFEDRAAIFLRWNGANIVLTAAMHLLSFKRPYLTKVDLTALSPAIETDLLYLG